VKKKEKKIFLGADIGGTWIRAALYRTDTDVIKRETAARTPGLSWIETLSFIARRWRITRAESLTVGARGVWTSRERSEAAKGLKDLARRVRVLSDMELAHRSALGGLPGIIVIGGTGSAAYGEDIRGKKQRAGGLGPLFGDPGSAFWIGREWLKRSPRSARRRASRPDATAAVAQTAKSVLKRASTDPAARRIRNQAAKDLAGLALEAAKNMNYTGPIPLSWSGGLFEDPGFLKSFKIAIGKKFNPAPPLIDPEVYAALDEGMLK
jgi:N-acetylglucosamine kinase-like BadF-type ATPase